MTHHLSDESFFLSQLRKSKGNDKAYIKAVWEARDAEHGPVKKSSKKGWPFVRVEHRDNVQPIRNRAVK